MAGVGGLYSGIRGLDLGPTKLRNDEEARRKQMAEDMRRALMGEKLQASELLLRKEAQQAQQAAQMRQEALQRELQTSEQGFRSAENTAQRGFVGQESALDRASRSTLQGNEIRAREEGDVRRVTAEKEMQGLAMQGQWAQLEARLTQDADQFTKELALKEKGMAREEKFDALRSKAMELQNTAAQLQIAAEQRRAQGMLSPEEEQEHQRAMQTLQRQSAAYQNEAARYAQGRGRQFQEAAADQDLRMGEAQEENTRARTVAQDIENTKGITRGAKAAGVPAVQKYANLDKDDRGEAAKYDRIVGDGKASDVQTAIAKGWQKINELTADDDDDAKERIKKIRAFITKAKKSEGKNWAPSLWYGAPGLASRLLPDSDLEDEAEELGLHSGL